MKPESWRLHICWLGGSIEPRENTFHLIHYISAYSAAVAAFEKALQSTMAEISYHATHLNVN
jgi:hypothetical protein